MNSYVRGILYAVQELVLLFDHPGFASEIVVSSGYTLDDFLAAQKISGHETRKMNRFLRDTFDKEQS